MQLSATQRYIRKKFAIATGIDLQVESPTIIGAQAANELLDISEIKASFVLTEYNGKIYVSARSIDEVNVQVIMEKLGGMQSYECFGSAVQSYGYGRGCCMSEAGSG